MPSGGRPMKHSFVTAPDRRRWPAVCGAEGRLEGTSTASEAMSARSLRLPTRPSAGRCRARRQRSRGRLPLLQRPLGRFADGRPVGNCRSLLQPTHALVDRRGERETHGRRRSCGAGPARHTLPVPLPFPGLRVRRDAELLVEGLPRRWRHERDDDAKPGAGEALQDS